MVKLIKTLDVQNASLNVITAGRRLPLAQFTGKIEITEHQSMTPVLGRRCKVKEKRKSMHHSFYVRILNIRQMMSLMQEKYMKQLEMCRGSSLVKD
jgi:hypothetical protein